MAIYIGTKQISNSISNDLSTSWTTGNSSITTLSDEYCFELTATSTSSAYAYQTLTTPIPASGIPTSTNYQYIYLQAKVYSPSSNTGYPLFIDSSISSEGGTTSIMTLSAYLLGTETATSAALNDGEWHTISCLISNYINNKGYQELGFGLSMSNPKKNNFIKFKDLIVLDVTSLFGTTPTRQECDNEIFINNGTVYLRNSTIKTKIKDLYIGVGGIPKKVLVGYVGINNNGNNVPKIFFDNHRVKELFADMVQVQNITRNYSETGIVSINQSGYTSGLYYLFVFYNGYMSLYKIKNGVLSLTSLATAAPYARAISTTSFFTPIWALSNSNNTSTAVYGGSLILVSFPHFTEEEIDNRLNYAVLYRYGGVNDSSRTSLQIADTTNWSFDYTFTTRYGNGNTSGSNPSLGGTGFSIWNKTWVDVLLSNSSRPSYQGATYSSSQNTLTVGSVYGGSISVLKEYTGFKKFKLKTASNATPIEFRFPNGELWHNFLLSNLNIDGTFTQRSSTRYDLYYNGTTVYYNNNPVYTYNNGTYSIIQEFDDSLGNYYTTY